MCDDQMLNDTDDVFGGDTCAHCGATALESFDCALNGCRFGLLAEQEDCPTPPIEQRAEASESCGDQLKQSVADAAAKAEE
jgi:hypothetical protein